MSDWTFINNYAVTLSLIAKHPNITAPQLGEAIGLTERTVRKIITDLHIVGYVKKKKVGNGIILIVSTLPCRCRIIRIVMLP